MNCGAPEDFVSHPVADSGEAILHQENGLDRRMTMSIQKPDQKIAVELWRDNLGKGRVPPFWFPHTVLKSDPAELSRIGENEGAPSLKKHEMIVLGRRKIAPLNVDFSGHAEMNTEPVTARKPKEHSFSARFRANQSLTHKFMKSGHVRAPKNALIRVQPKIDNRLATRDAPLFAKPLHFSQFGHGRGYPLANREQSRRASPRNDGESRPQSLLALEESDRFARGQIHAC